MTLIQATPKSRAKGFSCSWCLVPGGRAGVWGAAGPLNRGRVIGARFRQGWARGRNAGPSSCWVSRAPGLCTCPPPPTPSCPSVHRGKCRYLPGIEPLPRPSQAHPASHLKMVQPRSSHPRLFQGPTKRARGGGSRDLGVYNLRSFCGPIRGENWWIHTPAAYLLMEQP